MTDQGIQTPQMELKSITLEPPATSPAAKAAPSARELRGTKASLAREVRLGLGMLSVLLIALGLVAYQRYQQEARETATLEQEREAELAEAANKPSAKAPPAQQDDWQRAPDAQEEAAAKLVQYEMADDPHTQHATAATADQQEPAMTGPHAAENPTAFEAAPADMNALPEQPGEALGARTEMEVEANEPAPATPIAEEPPAAEAAPQTEAELAEQPPHDPSSLQLAPPDQVQLGPPVDQQQPLEATPSDAGDIPDAAATEPAQPPLQIEQATPPEAQRLEAPAADQDAYAQPASGRRFGTPARKKQPGDASSGGAALQPNQARANQVQPGRHHDGDNLFSSEYAEPPVHQQPPQAAAADTGRFQHQGDTYTVGPNENFWVISKQLYGTGAYFKALYEHNRQKYPRANQLRAGDVISTPSAQALEQTYPQLCPRKRADNVPATMRPVSTQGHVPGGRTYVVEEGDTLFDIARFELGKASRWAEIYELNRDVLGNNFDYLKPGTQLALPAGEGAERLTEAPGDSFHR